MKKKSIDNKKIAVKILDPVEAIMLMSDLWSAPNVHRKQSTANAFDRERSRQPAFPRR
jgi:hypothetical protein